MFSCCLAAGRTGSTVGKANNGFSQNIDVSWKLMFQATVSEEIEAAEKMVRY